MEKILKHLVFITEHLCFGGAEVVLTDYLNAIPKDQYKITLLIRDDLQEKNYLLSRVPTHVEIHYIFSSNDLKSFPKRMAHKQFRNELTSRVKKILSQISSIDQIIDFSPVLDKVMPSFKSYNIILWMHGDKSHMKFFERMKYTLRIRHYSKIVLLCEEMRTQFDKLFPTLKDKFRVIPNPFDFKSIEDRSNDFSELSPTDQELMASPYSVSVARLVPGKDFFTLIKALEIVKNNGIPFTHYIIGDGELKAPLQEQINARGLTNQVILLGAKKNPFPWVRNSRFFVHSAIREGFGLVIVEAMSLNKAVIATACPVGPRDILAEGKYGRLFSLQDEATLAKHLEEFYRHPEIVKNFEQLSLARSKDFSKENILPIFEKAIFN